MKAEAKCPVCQSAGVNACSGLSSWAKCQTCGAWFRHPMPIPAELRAYYLGEFQDGTDYSETSMHATNVSVAQQYISQAERALGGFRWPGSRILDYGAGEGDLSQLLSHLGARVTALEPFGYELCRRKGIDTIRTLEEMPVSAGLDGVFMTEVLEHVEGPIQLLRQLGCLLSPAGWVFVSTPNSNSLKAHLLRGRWEERQKFGHLCLFSWATLALALREAGFEAIPCKRPMRFSNNPVRRLAQFVLQSCGLGGNLRAMGIKRTGAEGPV
jgi:SAM-dependent methyltransferase